MGKFFGLVILLLFIQFGILNSQNQHYKADSIRADKTYNKGIALFRKQNINNAIDTFNLSLNIRKRIYGNHNYKVGMVENALGISYRSIGQLDNALNFFLRAEKSYNNDSTTSKNTFARLYNNIGIVYKSQLNYSTAIHYYERAISILSEDTSSAADVYYNLAVAYFGIHNYLEALSIIENQKSNIDDYDKLYFIDLEASIYQVIDQNEKADGAYNHAIALAIKLFSEDDMEVAYEYLNYASFLITIGKISKASEMLEKAHKIIFKSQQERGVDIAEYYFIKGNLYSNKKVESTDIAYFKRQKINNLKGAIAAYKNGLQALNFDFDPALDSIPDVAKSLSLTQSLDFLKLIADTYVKIADIKDEAQKEKMIEPLNNALDYYRVTADIIQKARKEISSDESKIQLAGLEESTFHKMIKTAYQTYKLTGDENILEFAFKNAERIKASSVFDRLSGELAKSELIPDSLAEQEESLNYEITRKNELVYNLRNEQEPDSAKITEAESELFELKKQRDELNQYIETTYPSYYELKYSDQLLGINEIKKKLKNNEVLIEYVLSESDTIPELYAFFISKNRVEFISPEIDSTFVNYAVDYFRFMSDSRHMFTKNKDAIDFCVKANHLYKNLIYPFENEIRDKKLLIVPDGKLNYVAFDALIGELPDTSSQINFAKLKYLIKNNNINYSYSANLLYGFNKKERKSKNKLLAFAPEYSEDTISFDNKQLALMPLPGIKKEVELIAEEIKSRLFVGDEASEINFRKYSEEFEILHLAMHAFIDDSDPAFSSLAFSQNNNADAENNGRLNTADIYNLDLNARLTVLSACNTGSGELKKGEGVMSLARGFLYAGCPSIVMTLWEVDDKAGTQIMSSFYRNLKKGRTIDEALRLAKLKYLETANPRMAHPHYWLGYISIGDSSPLFRSYDYYFFGLLIIALLAVTIDQVIRTRKSRKKL